MGIQYLTFGYKGIEIDYGGGISPKWKNFTFTVGGLDTPLFAAIQIDYFELKTGVSWTGGPWTLSVNNWWSPNNFGLDTQSDALELGAQATPSPTIEAVQFLHAQHQWSIRMAVVRKN